MLKKVEIDTVKVFIADVLQSYGMRNEYAEMVADAYITSSYRGCGHHDIHDFANRIMLLDQGKVNPKPRFQKLKDFGAMESWDADNTLGELACFFGTKRAMELAEIHGMGFCTLRNTNHYLAATPYVKYAAEHGYIAIVLAKGAVNMSISNAQGDCMSALPMGVAYPTMDENTTVFDFCLAYVSMGQLTEKITQQSTVESWWGCDEYGQPTQDPEEMKRGNRYPIGQYKGFALSMLGEVLTGVLSGGTIMNQKASEHDLQTPTSHTIFVMKADAFGTIEEFRERASTVTQIAKELGGKELHVPGDGIAVSEKEILDRGYIEIREETFTTFNNYANRLQISRLEEIGEL